MNKKFLKYYMETEPEGTAKKYIFLVDNQDIAMNIGMSGYQALYLGQQEEEGYYSIDGFVGEMRSMQFQGSCQSSYHYVAACTVKWMNDRILEFCKDAARIEKGKVITWSKDKYNLFRQQVKDSFVADCAMTVLKALENCISTEKFIEKMKQFGWSVNWTEKRKHITFQNQDGRKVRDSNLSKTFHLDISKEGLENEFNRIKQVAKRIANIRLTGNYERIRAEAE